MGRHRQRAACTAVQSQVFFGGRSRRPQVLRGAAVDNRPIGVIVCIVNIEHVTSINTR